MWHALISDVFELVLEQLDVHEWARCAATCAAWRYATTHMRRTLALRMTVVSPPTWPMARHVHALYYGGDHFPDVRHLTSLHTLEVSCHVRGDDARLLPTSTRTLVLCVGRHTHALASILLEFTRINAHLTSLDVTSMPYVRIVLALPAFHYIAPECQLQRLHVKIPSHTLHISSCAPLQQQAALTYLHVGGTWSHEAFEAMSRLPMASRLRHLCMPGFAVTRESAPALARFVSLESLISYSVHVPPPILPALRSVHLECTDQVDASQLVCVLAASPQLTRVELRAAQLTHADATRLVCALHHLQSLRICDARALSPLTWLSNTRLTSLTLERCAGLSAETDLVHLPRQTLRQLITFGSMKLPRTWPFPSTDWPVLGTRESV
jgi:hypothetical protein